MYNSAKYYKLGEASCTMHLESKYLVGKYQSSHIVQ